MILFAVAAVYALLLCRVEADEAKKPAPDDPVPAEIKVIPLKNVVAADLTRTLEEIFSKKSNIRFALDETANAVIVRAPAAEMAEIQDLIKQVDTPRPENQAPRLELRIYDLRSLEPDKALEHSLRLLFVKSGNFSIDKTRKLVIVSADRNTLDKVEALLARLETMTAVRPDQDVQVRVVWLINGADAEKMPPTPDDLKEVLPGLAKLGIDKPRLAAQTVVNVSPNAAFHVEGMAKPDGPCRFTVAGRFSDNKESQKLKITIQASRNREKAIEEICNLETEISAPPGHLVVLGVTPTETATSAFVVQVLHKEAKKPETRK
jgi:hypothetical protein